ncbi:chromosome transmission fidelity protein 18 [Podospora fimiseda]|uniref:Chromosome transmission fidelity protein 18 n=1 Tax=Podospora fimiseda TaxID=252190 RepID=A0AAN7BSW7_9PEZI|nr:chromosome transmission fidelity protein 18 [Podospora fimiseda]
MLAPSSPIAFPPSSSPVKSKRPRPPGAQKTPKPRVLGGFLADDSSSEEDDDDEVAREPSPKRRMLEQQTQNLQIEATEIPSLAREAVTTPPDSQTHEETQEERERYESLFGAPVTRMPEVFVNNDPFIPAAYGITTCSGKTIPIRERKPTETVSYSTMVAARSKTKEGRAKKSYFGIDIHALIDEANAQVKESAAVSVSTPPTNPDKPVHSIEETNQKKQKRTLLWTEKYRARNFMDLVGDDLTNRQVLRWLKRWDPIVFPHSVKTKPSVRRQQQQQSEEERPHRKILMLHGPPGLGKTTLAHVCARQAGYEVLEINASDDRSKDVVKGRIRTSLGTETVKTVGNKTEPGKRPSIARPVCVVVDEVDGVVGGSGAGGEGGFVKALIDLVLLDQKNSTGGTTTKKKRKTDDFRQMRPLILICNDVYHPSLRPLRQSGLAEVIHVGKPPVEAVVTRLKSVFEKEGIVCEKDAARKLCEATWGITTGIDARKGAEGNAEGDLRGVMVVGEWVAGRLKATSTDATPYLTRQWIDKNIIQDLNHGGGGARGLGRGSTKEIVNRIFQEGAGFPKQAQAIFQDKKTMHEQPQAQLGFMEQQKKYAMARLLEMIDTSGEIDRIMTEVFLEYPNRDFNDDCFMTKPNIAYEWMHFHDTCSHRIFSSQEWELAPYVSQPILACHHLFASPRRYQPQNDNNNLEEPPLPFTGPRADFAAREAEKVNRAALYGILGQLPASLSRAFRSPEDVATDFLPYLIRLVSPDVKPVVVGGIDSKGQSVASVRREGEKAMVRRAAAVLAEVRIALHKGKIEAEVNSGPGARPTWVYRMEPDLDTLGTFETASSLLLSSQAPTRYAVRQVLDQELQQAIAAKENASRQARLGAATTTTLPHDFNKENITPKSKLEELKALEPKIKVKKDFFGRVIVERPVAVGGEQNKRRKREVEERDKVWVTYHEGINNAVRKPISFEEFMRGL